MTAPPAIEALEVEKGFGATVAVNRVSLVAPDHAVVALLGPSGSGKTTLLRMVAGFEVPDAGRVSIGGRQVAGPGHWVEPEARRTGMVFQDGALFPHLSVAGNVGFGQPRSGRVEACLDLVGLADRARSYPHELSGGERQRVALARALANEPEVVLLDEPFASLDVGLRVSLREEVAAILRAAGASALLVTHDQDEALSLADVVYLMRDGRIEQSGSPEDVYARPRSRWAAEFLGGANPLAAVVATEGVECELGRLPADAPASGPVQVLVRPEAVALAEPGVAPVEAVPVTVVGRSFLGHELLVRVRLPSGQVLQSRQPGTAPWRHGDDVRAWLDGPASVVAGDGHAVDGAGESPTDC